MSVELIKIGVSTYLKSKGNHVLDLFFKQPCDKCSKQEKLDKLNLLPDFLVRNRDRLYFSFIITGKENLSDMEECISNNSEILPFTNYLVEDTSLYEIQNINDFENKELLSNNLEIPQHLDIGRSSKTYKSKTGQWGTKRRYGQRGEDELNKYLLRRDAKIMDLNYNAPCDNCLDIQNWRRFNKLPDGIAKLDTNVFLYDSKAKSGRYLIVNERDYEEYRAKLDILPVKVYILIFSRDWKELKEIYEHNVNLEPKRTSKQWDGNITVILNDEVNQVY